MNRQISLVVPTFNRALFLNELIKKNIKILKDFNINIYIFDNASTDQTESIVRRWKKIYSNIIYYRNKENLGSDKNIEIALKFPDTKYIWLLGDSYQIPDGGIPEIIEIVEKYDYELIVLNESSRVVDVPTQVFEDQNKILVEIGWHMTCMACLIYSKKLIEKANFYRFENSRFNQLGIIFEYINKSKFKILWLQNLSIYSTRLNDVKKQSWQNIVFFVWMKKWVDFVMSLPMDYELISKTICIKKHNQETKLFSIMKLLSYRMNGFLNINIYNQYRDYINISTSQKKIIILVISLFPKSLLKVAFRLIKK